MDKVSVVVPAYNEEHYIGETLNTLKQCSWAEEIIVVNDGSRDRTGEIADVHSDKSVHLERNYGKSYAIKQGWKRASGDIIVCIDCDLGASAAEAEKLIQPLLTYSFIDVVIGRLAEPKKRGFGLLKKRTQRLVLKKTGCWLTAPLSGQRAFRRRWLPYIQLDHATGFGVEVAMNIRLLQAGATVVEVDTDIKHRETGKDLKGFIHRGKQWLDIEKTIWSVSI
ncbi:glycosyltransferase family 2 protein [Desertibacillus haloalkaliphilus]|uniref:glycosyltransferase family 2 protein n=1 Tax=Desertibacillus haloalkaliphilus TaxID=1328930 RepID=UPI001C27E807|nr:glycosyltransferase family 2 protein [Desertibacillus haloalkaliphilus]MBU8907747.1 glycosyltransferase family 2 protein [Desertibacillus haloalkaliphilus]